MIVQNDELHKKLDFYLSTVIPSETAFKNQTEVFHHFQENRSDDSHFYVFSFHFVNFTFAESSKLPISSESVPPHTGRYKRAKADGHRLCAQRLRSAVGSPDPQLGAR